MSAVTARKPVAAPSLNADQSAAVALLMDSIDRGDPIARLLGYAGTGKSFTVVRLLQRYAALRPVILSAPTNKAVSVLRSMAAELGGKAEASTIHRILGLRPEIDEQRGRLVLKRFREPQIDQGALIVVDECSMVDSALMRFIQQAAHDARAQVLYVGDPGQLTQEVLRRINMHQRDVVVFPEQGRDLRRLVLAQQAGVHEHAGQLVADGLVDQYRSD